MELRSILVTPARQIISLFFFFFFFLAEFVFLEPQGYLTSGEQIPRPHLNQSIWGFSEDVGFILCLNGYNPLTSWSIPQVHQNL